MTGASELTRTLRTEVGDALRMAAVYTETGFDYLYLRDDLEPQYTPAEIETLRREIIVFALGKEKLQHVIHAGELRRIIYETEEALALQVPMAGHAGVFVSIELSEKPRTFDVVDAVQEWIERSELPTGEN